MSDSFGRPLGLKFGQPYPWRGEEWLIYDYDADSQTPRGVTLVLVSKDLTRMVSGVRL